MTNTQDALRKLIADDAYAMSFQSMRQYRTALLNALTSQSAGEQETDVINAAEAYAANYESDERDCIQTDVMNAFYAGVTFAQSPASQEPDGWQQAMEYMNRTKEDFRRALDKSGELPPGGVYAGPVKEISPASHEPIGQLAEEQFGRGQVMWFKKPADGTLLYAAPIAQPAMPEGLNPVPIKPTKEMWDAAWSAFGATKFEDMHPILSIDHIKRLYAMFHEVMLSAAPSHPIAAQERASSINALVEEFLRDELGAVEADNIGKQEFKFLVRLASKFIAAQDKDVERSNASQHPWQKFLTARADVIDWLWDDGESCADIAKTLSMDQMQVALIRMRDRSADELCAAIAAQQGSAIPDSFMCHDCNHPINYCQCQFCAQQGKDE